MASRYEQTDTNPSFSLPVAPLGHADGGGQSARAWRAGVYGLLPGGDGTALRGNSLRHEVRDMKGKFVVNRAEVEVYADARGKTKLGIVVYEHLIGE